MPSWFRPRFQNSSELKNASDGALGRGGRNGPRSALPIFVESPLHFQSAQPTRAAGRARGGARAIGSGRCNSPNCRSPDSGDCGRAALVGPFGRASKKPGGFRPRLHLAWAASGNQVLIAAAFRTCGREPAARMEELRRKLLLNNQVSNFGDRSRGLGSIPARGSSKSWPARVTVPDPERTRFPESAFTEVHGFRPSFEADINAAPFFDRATDVASPGACSESGPVDHGQEYRSSRGASG